MSAEFIKVGKVTRCRRVTRSVDANGNLVEVWGDFLPLAYCGADGGRQSRTLQLGEVSRDENGHLTERPIETVYSEKPNVDLFQPPVTTDKNLSSESKFLLIAAAFVVGLLGLVFVFKK